MGQEVGRRLGRVTKWLRVVPYRLCLLLVLCGNGLAAHAAQDEARVLILNGSDPYLPAFLIIDSAMRATLDRAGARRVVLFSEPLDAQRFPAESLEPEFLALLAKKYAGCGSTWS